MSKLKVTTISDPDNDNTALTIDTSGNVSVSQGFVPPTQLSHRNLIINGAMQVAQRGTSFTGLTNGSSEYTLDRFKFIESGNQTSVFTVSQDTNTPDYFGNSLKLTCTTSGSGHNVIEITQSIEAQNLQSLAFGTSNAKSFTLSFWVKCSQSGTGNVSFYNLDALRQRAENYTINVADTWEYKTITVSGDTSGAFNNDNGTGLGVYFPIAASTSYSSGSTGSWGSYSDGKRGAGMTIDLTTSTSDYLQITGVQLEVGSVATPFEHRSYGEELVRCQRYYQEIEASGRQSSCIGYRKKANHIYPTSGQNYHLPVTMRSAPTFLNTGMPVTFTSLLNDNWVSTNYANLGSYTSGHYFGTNSKGAWYDSTVPGDSPFPADTPINITFGEDFKLDAEL